MNLVIKKIGDKTCVVETKRVVKHRTGKSINRVTKLLARDVDSSINVGDKVKLISSRPFSKKVKLIAQKDER